MRRSILDGLMATWIAGSALAMGASVLVATLVWHGAFILWRIEGAVRKEK